MVACSKLNSHAGIVIPNPAKPLVLGVDCLKHVVSDAEPGPGPAEGPAEQKKPHDLHFAPDCSNW